MAQKQKKQYPNTRLKDIMNAAGISLMRMSYDLGMNHSDLSKIRNGWVTPGEELQEKLASYVGVKPADIWPDMEETI